MSEQLVNTYNYLVPAAGTTRSYRVTQNFTAGDIKHCDFRNMALDGVSFVPSGVLVDNTRGTGDCVITIIEFAWRIVVPAGTMINMPYPAPYNQTATIEGEGDITVVFVDYPVIPFISGSGGGSVSGIQDITAGTGINIDKTNPANPVISADGGGGGAKPIEVVLRKAVTGSGKHVLTGMDVFLDTNSIYDGTAITLPANVTHAEMIMSVTHRTGTQSNSVAFYGADDDLFLFITMTPNLAQAAQVSNYLFLRDQNINLIRSLFNSKIEPEVVVDGGDTDTNLFISLTFRFFE